MKSAFGTLLKDMREQSGLTQAELAAKARITRVHVGFLERGDRSPSLEVYVKLCRALQVAPSSLMERLEKLM